MCRVKEPRPYFKGQGHTGNLNVNMQPFVSGLSFSYAWKDFEIIWLKYLPYQDDLSQERITLLPQRSRSHLQFLCLYACYRVRAVILLCIEGF